jgi:hypothetical protein
MTFNSHNDTADAPPVTYTRAETMNDVYLVRPIEADQSGWVRTLHARR